MTKYIAIAIVVSWLTFVYHDEVKVAVKQIPGKAYACQFCKKVISLLEQ